MEQNRDQNKPHIYSQRTIDREAKNTQWEKDLSSINHGRKTDNDMHEIDLHHTQLKNQPTMD